MIIKAAKASSSVADFRPGGKPAADDGSHMKVVVRIRPENAKEMTVNNRRVVEALNETALIFDPLVADDARQFCPSEQIRDERQRAANRSRLLHFRRREKNMTFTFDRVFRDQVQNEEIYEQTTATMLDAFLNGINCSVFCYGATGAGKTFTMLGGRSQSGVIFFTMRSLYERVDALLESGAQYNVKVSYLEIYNEQVRDLLAKWTSDYADDTKFEEFLKARTADRQSEVQAAAAHAPPSSNGDDPSAKRTRFSKPSSSSSSAPSSAAGNTNGNANKHSTTSRVRDPSNDLQLLEDAQVGVVVHGITYHEPSTAEELMRMLEYGNLQRTQHPTDANSESSRSHAVFQVYFRQKVLSTDRVASSGAGSSITYRSAKFSLIDLAGSERATATSNNGMRFREGANINKSLLALGNCINSLADGKKAAHIPYRNSKLTRLLKDSLAGNCMTCMIAAVSPSAVSYEDTYNTLKYADRARAIRIDTRQNLVNAAISTLDLSKIVDSLRRENAQLRSQLEQFTTALPASVSTQSAADGNAARTSMRHSAAPARPAASTAAAPAAPAPNCKPQREALVIDRDHARLLERDMRLLRKLESWRRLHALGIDLDATASANDRLAQFIDANYNESIATNMLVCAANDQDQHANTGSANDSQLQTDAMNALFNLIDTLCAEADEDKLLIRDLLSIVGRFFSLLKFEQLVTQANVDEIEHIKQRIITLERARARHFRQPFTRAATQLHAPKRDACAVRWAERLEVDQPRTAYFDEPEVPDDGDDDEMSTSAREKLIADATEHHQSAIAALPSSAQRVRGLEVQALARANFANAVRSLFTSSSTGDTTSKAALTKKVRPVFSAHNTKTASSEVAPKAPLSESSLTTKTKRKQRIIVDEVDHCKKKPLKADVEEQETQETVAHSEHPAADSTFTCGPASFITESFIVDNGASSTAKSKDMNGTQLASPFKYEPSFNSSSFFGDDSIALPNGGLGAKFRDSMLIVKRDRQPKINADRIDEAGEDQETEKSVNSTFTLEDEEELTVSNPNATITLYPKTTTTLIHSGSSNAAVAPDATNRLGLNRKRGNTVLLFERSENVEDGMCPKKQGRIEPLLERFGNTCASSSGSEKPSLASSRGNSSSNLRFAHRDPPPKLRRYTSASNCIAMMTASTSSPPVPATNTTRPINKLTNGAFTFRQAINEAPTGPSAALPSSHIKHNAATATITTTTNHSNALNRPLLKARRTAREIGDSAAVRSMQSLPTAAISGAVKRSNNTLTATTTSFSAKQVPTKLVAGRLRSRNKRTLDD